MQNIEQEALRLIKLKMKEKGWDCPSMAPKLGIHKSTLAKMLQSSQLKLSRLKEISELLEFNFLRALADQIEVNDPPKYTVEVTTKERIRELEIENAVLMKVLRK